MGSLALFLTVALLLAGSLPCFAGRGGAERGGFGGGAQPGLGRRAGPSAGGVGQPGFPGGSGGPGGFGGGATGGLQQQDMGFSQRNANLYSPNVNVAQSSVLGSRNWNSRNDVDINASNYYRGAGAVAAGAAYGAAVGSVTTSLPPVCSQTYVGGTIYYNCSGTYYLPSYQGSTVTYEVVSPP